MMYCLDKKNLLISSSLEGNISIANIKNQLPENSITTIGGIGIQQLL